MLVHCFVVSAAAGCIAKVCHMFLPSPVATAIALPAGCMHYVAICVEGTVTRSQQEGVLEAGASAYHALGVALPKCAARGVLEAGASAAHAPSISPLECAVLHVQRGILEAGVSAAHALAPARGGEPGGSSGGALRHCPQGHGLLLGLRAAHAYGA
eukprot:1160261-Pelagomonas_calceolata.AAC.23